MLLARSRAAATSGHCRGSVLLLVRLPRDRWRTCADADADGSCHRCSNADADADSYAIAVAYGYVHAVTGPVRSRNAHSNSDGDSCTHRDADTIMATPTALRCLAGVGA